MNSKLNRARFLALAIVCVSAGPLWAGDLYNKTPAAPAAVTLPTPAEVQALDVYPSRIALHGSDDAQQLILTARLAGDHLQDLTGDVQYDIADSKIARVTPSGRVLPLANGSTEIRVRYGDRIVKVPVSAEHMDENLPINFGNQIVPIFTKLGCNSGGCHGKASGQNGFKLSLLGFEPELDYAALVKEARGRRVFPAAPDYSLLLRKASGQVGHGGGKKLEADSDEYKLIRRWIASGLPFGSPDDPVVTRIEVYPPHQIVARQNRQQFAVYAHYSDGFVQDVTRRAQYECNDPDIAAVDATGLVRTQNLSGEVAVMARYQGQVATFRATVPLGAQPPDYRFEERTLVDRYTHKKWQELQLVPSDICTDEQFLRRASLDITGTLPTPAQVTAFVNNTDPNKRDQLIDSLLETPEYSYYFANKWADVLRVKRGTQNNNQNRAYGTFSFHNWIREAIAADKPYDEFAGEIIGAVGDETRCPPTVWYKDTKTADEIVDNLAQVFLGLRMQCAQCHHHPYEKYSQDDYWSMAAFFGRLARKNIQVPGQSGNQNQQRQALYSKSNGNVVNLRTKKPAPMKPLDGEVVQATVDEDPRQKLIDWLVDAKNPYFARSVANRYWAHFFGHGIVDPLDDMRATNPPSNPELLDALARDLVDHKYSLKHLVRTICKSRTYQLSAGANEFNKHDKQAYSRYYPKRMTAEVLFDAVSQVTGSPTVFQGLPQDTYSPKRAIMLPDESFQSYFLDVFGRPQRLSPCECERSSEANLAQALHLLNSEEVQGKIARTGGRADQLVKDPRPEAEKIEELFLWAWGRKPSPRHLQLALDDIERNGKNKKLAYENIIWALLNTKEFVSVR